MTEIFEYVATCLFGLEHFVCEEIDALGYERTEVIDGRVTFRGDISAIARCNLWLRTAERLYLKLGSFSAATFDELFEGTRALPWESWIGKDDCFPVKGHAIKSRLFSLPDCQRIVKKAVAERLKSAYGISWFPEEGVTYQIEFFILKDKATLMIDTSGSPLHKRGYRKSAGEAPLRETLACAMVKISRPREEVLLWDPFCGSGTIPIEAALLMTNTAPGLYRSFAAEAFYDIPPKLFDEARGEAREMRKLNTAFEAFASDIDSRMCALASENIKRAGVGQYVKAFCRDALTLETGGRRGTIVCNPPYGERLSDTVQTERLYREMGQAFSKLDRWQIYILCESETFERLYGRRADKVRRLYNGMLRCRYYQFFRQPGSGVR